MVTGGSYCLAVRTADCIARRQSYPQLQLLFSLLSWAARCAVELSKGVSHRETPCKLPARHEAAVQAKPGRCSDGGGVRPAPAPEPGGGSTPTMSSAPEHRDFAALPSPCILQVFCLAESSKDAMAWRLACKSFYAVCGKVDMLQLRVLGDARAAASELDASARDISTWFGLDLDFAPMDLVQQGRMTSPFVLRPEQAKLVEQVMKARACHPRRPELPPPAPAPEL